MTALKFVDYHNMVAYLEQPTDSDDFIEIVDFLNADLIRYALTVNPTIYVSCIEQFWSTESCGDSLDRDCTLLTSSLEQAGSAVQAHKTPRETQLLELVIDADVDISLVHEDAGIQEARTWQFKKLMLLKRVSVVDPVTCCWDTEKVEGSVKQMQAGSKERVEESSKREEEEFDVDNTTKKQKVEDETEQAKLKECFEIIPFDEDAVNTIPLATKQAPIVDYKVTRDARKIYYHITRADGSTKVYMRFKDMLKMFNREDLFMSCTE
ncbi:hypothetical protein Tco_1346330 [Tanacetum coccineum]